jgi:Large ribosomal RNA subunit accumulation protein YceD
MTPEFCRLVPLERIRAAGLTITVEADAAERAALAARLGVPELCALSCRFRLRPAKAGAVMAEGELRARVRQVSVVSLEEFEAELAEDFLLRFVPEGSETAELDPESVDEMPYAGAAVDLGEAAVEQLALALDPYPRQAGEELPGESDETPENPFLRLKRDRRE